MVEVRCAVRWASCVALAAMVAGATAASAAAAARRASAPAKPAVRATTPPRSSALAARLAADTLARVGDAAITAADLERRLALMPFAGRAMAPDSAKRRALESLVGELLLAREAARRGHAPDAAERRRAVALENALIRDALYRDEVAARVRVRPAAVDSLARTASGTRTPSAAQRRNAADTLRSRGEGEVAREFMAQVLGAATVRIERDAFLAFADTLRDVVLANEAAHRTAQGFRIGSDDVDGAVERLGARASATLLRVDGDSLTVGDIGEAFRFHLVQVKSLRRQAFAIEMNQALRAVMESELMSREARRRGYAERDDVRRELAAWTATRAAASLEQALAAAARSTDEDAIRALVAGDFESAVALTEVDVQEVLCANAARAAAALAELRAGASFDSLARAVSRRDAWAPAGGRSGWVRAADIRPLGDAALLARLGALSGPLALREGHSVYRVLGRRLRAPDDSTRAALATARDAGLVRARADAVARETAALAAREDVRLEYARLDRVSVPTFSMYTKRFLGFGGEMIAAPMIVPRWEWRAIAREADSPRP